MFQKFIELNGLYADNPHIQYQNNEYATMDKTLNIRTINRNNCEKGFEKILIGQKETFALCDIQNGAVVGQYIGNELTRNQFHKIYNGTRDEKKHFVYSLDTELEIGEHKIELYIDTFEAYKNKMDEKSDNSHLLRINDGREDFTKTTTTSDKQRINTRIVSVLVNGWPAFFIQATKDIKKGESMWLNYGPFYKNVLDQIECIDDQIEEMKENSERVAKIDLREKEPIDVEALNQDTGGKKRTIMNSYENDNDNTNNSENSHKRQRIS